MPENLKEGVLTYYYFRMSSSCRLSSPALWFSYIRTQDGVEVDLVVERPGKPLLCIEIKSGETIDEKDIKSFINLTKDIENSEAICICDDKYAKKIQHVAVLPWRIALQEYFGF